MSLKLLEEALNFRDNYEAKVQSAADYIKDKLGNHKPIFGIVLGSGLGELADSIDKSITVPYEEIPYFPTTTIEGHEGKMLIGELEGVPVIGLKGRKHYYEVADEPFNNGMLKAVFGVHVLANLGVKNYFVTNAAGGLNQKYDVGNIMVLKSHIHLQPNPLLGRHHQFTRIEDNTRVWRFQPMSKAYDPKLKSLLLQAGSEHKEQIHVGTYLAVTGPTYETEGECLAFRDGLKADAVGMSTTAEVIVARNRGMNVVGMSCITNKIAKDGTNATDHNEVKAILESKEVKDRLSSTVREFFKRYKTQEKVK
jgi:purine-nucleoside phosphorylase